MRSSPPMPEEIKAGFYPRFEHGWRKAELIGRWVMLLVVLAAALGRLGGGPVHGWQRTVLANEIRVDYPPLVRFGTPAGLTVHLAATPGQDRVAVSFPSAIVKKYALQSVFPQPLTWNADASGNIRMVFATAPGTRETVVEVGGMPSGAGLVRMAAWADGQAAARWTQLVLP